MKTFITLLISSLFLVASCDRNKLLSDTQYDDNDILIKLPFKWKKSLHKNGIENNGLIDLSIYYNDNIVIPTTNGKDNKYLTMINPDDGEELWNWNDNYLPYSDQIIIFNYYQYNNLLTYQNGTKSYCINLDNGTTQWKEKRNASFLVAISGLEENVFSFGETNTMYPEYSESVVYKGNINSQKIQEFIIPNFTFEHIAPGDRIGDVTRVLPYVYNGVQHLAIIWQEPKNVTSIYDWQTYLGLYNFETNQWVYEKAIMNDPIMNGVLLAPPVIYNDKMYANIGNKLVCHDLSTGEQIWSKYFPQDFMFSGFIIEEDKIIANCEDTYTYCLNPENGNTIWKTETSGTCGRMSYLNGIVYFIGGSSGRLHAIDINTGEHVWKLDAGLFEDNSTGVKTFKTNAVYVFPADGNKPAKVIALSHLNAYCFEAYQ